MSDDTLQKLESRVQFLRKEAEAYKQQSYQQADLLRDVVPALSRLGHAANEPTLEAALRLSRGVQENSQNVDTIRSLADDFLSIFKHAATSGELVAHDTAWRLEFADALDALLSPNRAASSVSASIRNGEPIATALAPLVDAVQNPLAGSGLGDGAWSRLADTVATLPLGHGERKQAHLLSSRLRADEVDPAEWVDILEEVSELLERVLAATCERDQRMHQLLELLSGELGVVEAFLQALDQRDDVALSSALSVQVDIGEQSAGIASIFERSESVQEIRSVVLDKSRAIRARMDAYAEASRQEHEKAKRESALLSARLTRAETKLHETQEALTAAREAASIDFLTGLHNRRAFEEIVNAELSSSDALDSLHCIIWDIDHFKLVNDTHGHQVGDRVLRSIASALRDRTQTDDTVARLGGEEFVSVVRVDGTPELFEWAESVRTEISLLTHDTGSGSIAVSVSCGITRYQRGDSLVSMLARADKALYDAKHQGRNCCRVAA